MPEELNYEMLREMITRCQWTFAKTMPWAPHEYIVRGKCPLTDEEFLYFIDMQLSICITFVEGQPHHTLRGQGTGQTALATDTALILTRRTRHECSAVTLSDFGQSVISPPLSVRVPCPWACCCLIDTKRLLQNPENRGCGDYLYIMVAHAVYVG